MSNINYNEFQPGQGVSAPALNENFTLTNNAIENLELTLNSAVSSLTSTTTLKADKNGSSAEKFYVDAATETNQAVNLGQLNNSALTPVGTIIWYAGSSAPSGYLLCNGSNVSRTTYADLFTVVGVKYGTGNGTTTFTLPNLIGKFAEGASSSGTYKSAGLPDHAHSTLYVAGSNYDDGDPGQYCLTASGGANGINTSSKSYTGSVKNNSIYGNSDTVQPASLTLLPCIKY